MKKIGFIGTGNMGQAMLEGLINKRENMFEPCDISVCDIDMAKLQHLNQEYGFSYTTSAPELVKMSDVVVLAVKPPVFSSVLNEILGIFGERLLISIVAGKTLSHIEEIMGTSVKAVRAMPNTPALVGQGMSALCPNANVTEDEMNTALSVFNSFGKAEVLGEELFSAFTAICGSSPAYVFMFIEALADAAVLAGMPRALAYEFSAQAVLGSAAMVLETDKHPGELKDMVCSPGGTTIEAVAALERYGFRSAVINAVNFCVMKAESMAEK